MKPISRIIVTIGALAWLSGCESSEAWNRIVYCSQDDMMLPTASLRSDGGFVAIGGQRDSDGAFLHSWVVMIDEFGQPSKKKPFDSAYSQVNLIAASPTSDGGFIATGYCRPMNGMGYYLSRLDPDFEIVWEQCWDINADGLEISFAVCETAEGGAIIATNRLNSTAVALLQIDSNGNVGQPVDLPDWYIYPEQIIQTSEGGYVLAGMFDMHCDPFCIDPSWMIKLDPDLNVEWSLHGRRQANTVCQVDSGDLVAISSGDDLTTSITKVTQAGEPVWERPLTSVRLVEVISRSTIHLEPLVNCEFLAADDLFFTGASQYIDAAVVRIGDDGIIDWLQTYGGSDLDEAIAVSPGADGRYLVLGTTRFTGGYSNADHFSRYGAEEALWVIRIDGEGNRY